MRCIEDGCDGVLTMRTESTYSLARAHDGNAVRSRLEITVTTIQCQYGHEPIQHESRTEALRLLMASLP